MELGTMSKRQQPDQRAENSRSSPMGLQHSEKIPHRKLFFSWPLNKNVNQLSDNGILTFFDEKFWPFNDVCNLVHYSYDLLVESWVLFQKGNCKEKHDMNYVLYKILLKGNIQYIVCRYRCVVLSSFFPIVILHHYTVK